MFHNIPEPMLERMAYLEKIDTRDRQDDTPFAERLRQIPPETGRFLALLATMAPPGRVLEVGTSGGYSGMWLALACRQRGDRLTTFDILPNKTRLAQETFDIAGVSQHIDLIQGDARQYLPGISEVAFCFLDAEKDVYAACYELLIPNLVPGGLLVADNVISHQQELAGFTQSVQADPRVDALVVPIGKGVLVCRKLGSSV
ncbi:MAG: methyltransferase [Chloroflexi bacterium]|nr:methyltransferase [Chloroflexota bacterium]